MVQMATHPADERMTEEKDIRNILIVAPHFDWLPSDGQLLGKFRVAVTRTDCARLTDLEWQDWSVVAFLIDPALGTGPTEILESLREAAPDATLLAMSQSPDIREAVEYLKGGVYEYLPLPVDAARLSIALEEAVANNDAYREISQLNRMLLEEKEELAAKNRELVAISSVARAVSRSLELDEVLDRLVSCVEETFQFDRVGVGLVDPSDRCERTRITRGRNALAASGETWDVSANSGSPWIQEIYHRGLTLRVVDPLTDKLVAGTALAAIHPGPFVKVPMLARGSVVGTITVDNHASRIEIGDEEVGVLKVFADTAAIAVENSRLYSMVRELSLRDELTGLYNRRYLMDRAQAEINHAERRERPVTLLMLDLDYFKKLNDLNDHLTGDEALKAVAKTLQGKTRGIDTVARFGGEEMVVLLPATNLEEGVVVAEKLRAAIEELKVTGEEKLPWGRLTVSVGVASYPVHGENLHDVIEQADRALYKAKNSGRNRVVTA